MIVTYNLVARGGWKELIKHHVHCQEFADSANWIRSVRFKLTCELLNYLPGHITAHRQPIIA